MRKGWVVIALAMALSVLHPAVVQGQKRESQLRTVYGAVVDKQGNPVASGLVYLKNLKTRMVRTYIADQGGHYRFSGLDPNVDYEIHAEHRELTSATHKISNSDTASKSSSS